MADKTRWVFDEETADDDLNFDEPKPNVDPTGSAFTQSLGATQTARATELETGNQDSTRLIDGGGAETSDKTVVFSAATEDQVSFDTDFAENVDPVVGWLVVLKGPGKGNSIPLGHGMNLIGRNKDQRAPLPYGDKLISGSDHAKIMYEDRQFFIAHGSGKNITKVNGKMIPNMVPLQNHALIQLTKATTLAFVALCGDDFDWADVKDL